MKKTATILGIIGAAIVLFIGFIISANNNFITLEEEVNTSLSNVSVQLQRRADLIPNLVDTVKGYVKHEEKVIEDITAAREKLNNATTVKEMSEANEQLTTALNSLNVVVENYPDLKASENFINLQDELAGTENRISTARKDYNDIAKKYNTTISTFPNSIIAKITKHDKKDYFEVTDKSKTDVPEVNFND